MKSDIIKSAIKAGLAITAILIIVIMCITIILQYEKEGEKNIPFQISRITIVSTAKGIEDTEKEEGESSTWKFDVLQNNDIYFAITKNPNYQKEEMIKNIKIDNIKLIKEPQIGNIKIYVPSNQEGQKFIYTDEFEITDEINFVGSERSNEKDLQIGNQGGNFSISMCNTQIGKYISNDEEIKHDASLIQKMGKTEEELKFKVSFDLTIELENKKLKTNVILDMPAENIFAEGTSVKIINDTSSFIFKRVV